MTCRHIAELLIDFVANDLTPEQADAVKKHLGACPPCVAYLESYQLTIRVSHALPCAPLPPELAERLMKAMKEIQKD